jgi:putative ABC transport system ATP-binding protein
VERVPAATCRPDRRAAATVLRAASRARPRDAVLGAVLAITHQLGEAAVPAIVGVIVGEVLARGSWIAFAGWLALLAADFVLLSLSYRFGARARMRARQAGAHLLRMRIAGRALDPRGGADRAPGELLSRAASDADRAGAWAANLGSSVAAVAVVAATSVVLLVASPLLGAIALVGTAAVLLAGRLLVAPVEARSHAEQTAAAAATVLAEDTVRGLRVLRGIHAEEAAAERYRRASIAGTVAARRAAAMAGAVDGASALLTGLLLAVVAVVGGLLALHGALAVPALVSTLGLTGFLLGPLRQAAGIPALRARSRASAARIAELLAAPPVVDDGDGPAGPEPGEPGASLLELDGILPGGAVRLRPGMTGIAVDAATGARLAQLLARDADPPEGAIRLDGRDLRRIPLDELRRRVVVSPHDAALFDGSIRDAIAAPPPAAHDAARAADVEEIAGRLPGGLDAPIGEAGSRLSGGERQRVALARALALDAPVLVLHDPTTAIDAVTEDGIARRLRELRAGRITVLLTASASLLARCDRVVRTAAPEPRVGA